MVAPIDGRYTEPGPMPTRKRTVSDGLFGGIRDMTIDFGVPMPPPRSNALTIRLPTATIEITEDTITSTLADGAETVATPTDTPEDRERAHSLGYDSPHAMDRDHDLVHSLLAAWLGLEVSPVLDGIAHDRPLTKAQSGAEEAAVLAIQRYAQEQDVDLVGVAERMIGGPVVGTIEEAD